VLDKLIEDEETSICKCWNDLINLLLILKLMVLPWANNSKLVHEIESLLIPANTL
jgi:hypothetical protein